MYREGAEDLETRVKNLERELAHAQVALSEAKSVRAAVWGGLLLVAGGLAGFGVASARGFIRAHYPKTVQSYRSPAPGPVHIDDLPGGHVAGAPSFGSTRQARSAISDRAGMSFEDQEQVLAKSRTFLLAAKKSDCASLMKVIHPSGVYMGESERTVARLELAGSGCKSFLKAFEGIDLTAPSSVVVDAAGPGSSLHVSIRVLEPEEEPYPSAGITLGFDRAGAELYVKSVETVL